MPVCFGLNDFKLLPPGIPAENMRIVAALTLTADKGRSENISDLIGDFHGPIPANPLITSTMHLKSGGGTASDRRPQFSHYESDTELCHH